MYGYQLKAWWKSAVSICVFKYLYDQLRTVLQHARITLNRFTTAFFVFSFVYCFIAGIIQSLLFTIDFEYSNVISSLVDAGRIPAGNMTYLEGPRGHVIVRMCNDVPHGQAVYPCMVIYNSSVDSQVHGIQARLGIPVFTVHSNLPLYRKQLLCHRSL